MLQSNGAQAGGPSAKVYKCVLTPNREDRSRYVVLVGYEPVFRLGRCDLLSPVRRVYQWVVDGDGTERFMCVRVTQLRWRDLQPGQAHVEMRDAWLAHVKEQKARVKAAKEAGHVQEATLGGGL